MNIFYYSDLCPDCPPFEAKLKELGMPYQSINITANMKNLKEFLKLRDTHSNFISIKDKGLIGIPCFYTTDNQCYFDYKKL